MYVYIYIYIYIYNNSQPLQPSSQAGDRAASATRGPAALALEGTKGVPKGKGVVSNNRFDRVLPSVLHMFQPSC